MKNTSKKAPEAAKKPQENDGLRVVFSMENVNVRELVKLGQRTFAAGANLCTEAEAFFRAMSQHQKNLADLVAELQALTKGDSPDLAAVQEAVDTIKEVFAAMDSLNNARFPKESELEDLDAAGAEESWGVSDEAKAASKARSKHFLERYFYHKERLGLTTQERVAEVTKLPRQHVSLLEQGKMRPQFKTLSKIAAAFGVDVTEFTGTKSH